MTTLLATVSPGVEARASVKSATASTAGEVATCLESQPFGEYGAEFEGQYYTAHPTGEVSVVDLKKGTSSFITEETDKNKALKRLEASCLGETEKSS